MLRTVEARDLSITPEAGQSLNKARAGFPYSSPIRQSA